MAPLQSSRESAFAGHLHSSQTPNSPVLQKLKIIGCRISGQKILVNISQLVHNNSEVKYLTHLEDVVELQEATHTHHGGWHGGHDEALRGIPFGVGAWFHRLTAVLEHRMLHLARHAQHPSIDEVLHVLHTNFNMLFRIYGYFIEKLLLITFFGTLIMYFQ